MSKTSFVKLQGKDDITAFVRADAVEAICDAADHEGHVYVQVRGNIIMAKGSAADVLIDVMRADNVYDAPPF